MSLFSFVKQLLKNEMPLQKYIENHNPKSVYDVERLERKYQQLIKTRHTYI
jgi:hypothetical protein